MEGRKLRGYQVLPVFSKLAPYQSHLAAESSGDLLKAALGLLNQHLQRMGPIICLFTQVSF